VYQNIAKNHRRLPRIPQDALTSMLAFTMLAPLQE
jgi:hypothetical protein